MLYIKIPSISIYIIFEQLRAILRNGISIPFKRFFVKVCSVYRHWQTLCHGYGKWYWASVTNVLPVVSLQCLKTKHLRPKN